MAVVLWNPVAGEALAAEPADQVALPAAVDRDVTFEGDVLPILQAHCLDCHGAEEPESGLNLLSRRSLLRGGDSGEPGVLLKNSADSYLIRVAAGLVSDVKMPPEGEPLSRGQVGVLRAWIDQGLVMPATNESADIKTDHWSFQPVGRPALPRLPAGTDWPGTTAADELSALDAFVLEKLAASDLQPSERADRRSLIRRLYFVMHGLPPTPDQIEQFVKDDSPNAWPTLVDRVLDDPRYGERWARHWLDLIRFGETHGFETNRERPNAWRYRDWVIDAFNSDKPYDDFVREQIAGDALGEPLGTGFLVAGPHDLVKSPDINLTLMQRQDELSDLINTTGTAFLGLTLGCARCHNHKFDPITQTDFYAVQAVFAGVHHADRELPASPDQQEQLARTDARIADLQQKLTRFIPPASAGFTLLDDEQPYADGHAGLELLMPLSGHGENPAGTEPGFANDPGSSDRMPNISRGKYSWWANQQTDVAAWHPLQRGRFRIWVSWGCGHTSHAGDAKFVLDRDGDRSTTNDQSVIATVNQKLFADGSGEVVNRSLWSGLFNAGVHDLDPVSTILLRGGETGTAVTADVLVLETILDSAADAAAAAQAMPRRPLFRDAVNARGNVETFSPTPARFVRMTIEATNSGSEPCIDELEIFSGGKNIALAESGAQATASGTLAGYEIHKLEHINDARGGNGRSWISNTAGRGWIQIELPEEATIDRIAWARDREGRFADRVATKYRIEVATQRDQWSLLVSSEDRLPVGAGAAASIVYDFSTSDPQTAQQGRQWLSELTAARREREELARTPVAYIGRFEQPGATHRLYRGEPTAPREEVSPGALAVIGRLELAATSPEQQRRIAFAEWIAGDSNPLTARVIVNRLWQHHFGAGLVDTPSDFGGNGTLPSHPERLDWLARDLMDHGWSLKHAHRRILLSRTWQQSSQPRPDALRVDGGTRLLWRFPPRRLEAEAIRDSMLAASGVIDLRMGGPGFSGFIVEAENVRHFFPKTEYGPEDWRRMVYMTKVRQELESVFGAFDCPDASQVMPKRSRSTTPLQALNLLNSSFTLQQAELLAERAESHEPSATGLTANDQAREPVAETPAVDRGNNATLPMDVQVTRAFVFALGREPDAAELADATAFATEHGLQMLCRALFNSNEFLFVP